MTTRQLVLAVLVFAFVCCAVMWYLESFRMQKMVAEWKSWVEQLPTAGEQA